MSSMRWMVSPVTVSMLSEILTQVIVGDLEEFSFPRRRAYQIHRYCLPQASPMISPLMRMVPMNEFLENDAGMRFDVGRRNHRVGEFGNNSTAPSVQFFTDAQLFHHGEQVDGHALDRKVPAWPGKCAGWRLP